MTIYLDSDYRCHLAYIGAIKTIETDIFDGKCKTFIEGYRFVPEGDTWTRSDGEVFHGQMVAPAVDYGTLEAAQEQYEKDAGEMSDMQTALEILGVNP